MVSGKMSSLWSNMRVNKIAVLGLGSIGRRHFRNAVDLGLEVVGFDPTAEKINEVRTLFSKEFPRASFSFSNTLERAIESSDAVIIASPSRHHLEGLKICINAGKHCFVEKPLATNMEGLEITLQEATERKLKIAVGFNLRYRPVVERAKSLLPDLGKILWGRFLCASYLPDWRKDTNYLTGYAADPKTGGVIFDISHEIDLARYLLGDGDVVACYADFSGLLGISSEDRADIVMRHETGSTSAIHLDYITRPRQRNFEIAGEYGILKVDLHAHDIVMIGRDEQILIKETHRPDDNNHEYRKELKDFVSAIENNVQPRCSGDDGLTNLKHILTARKIAGLPQ